MIEPKSYKHAQNEIENILEQIQGNEVELDQLTILIQRAKFLHEWCNAKLRETEEKINSILE